MGYVPPKKIYLGGPDYSLDKSQSY